MKTAILLGLGILIMTCMAGCAPKKAQSGTEAIRKDSYHKINAQEAKKMMDESDVTIIDVRTPEEYEQAHIPGAVNLPNEEIGEAEPDILGDKDAVLLIYCRSGRRSKEASDKLIAQGYTQIYDFGGIIDWTYDTVTGQ